MNYNEPTSEQIKRLKEQHGDRSLHLVEAADGDDIYFFVITGPTRVEYKKYNDEVIAAQSSKDDKTRVEAISKAIEIAALAQIRHPARDEVQRVFDYKPAVVAKFAEEIQNAAGATIEVRSKKL